MLIGGARGGVETEGDGLIDAREKAGRGDADGVVERRAVGEEAEEGGLRRRAGRFGVTWGGAGFDPEGVGGVAGDERGAAAELRAEPGGAERDCLVGAGVVELDDGVALPGGEEAGEALAEKRGGERAAVVENGVYAAPAEKGGKVASDGGVGGVGQAEFAESAGRALGHGVGGALGEKTVEDEGADFGGIEGEGAGGGEEFGAGERYGDRVRCGVGGRAGEDGFFGVAGGGDEGGPGPRVGGEGELFFEVTGERGVDVVSAEEEVFADGDAFESGKGR